MNTLKVKITETMSKRVLPILTSLFLAMTAFGAGSAEPAYAPEVHSVTMFTNGTSLVTYEAVVDGDGTLEMPVSGEDMLDILKTLVVQDLDGGTVSSAEFPAKDPINRTLGRLSIDLSGNPGIRDLLIRSRGMEVRVQAAESSISGVIMGLENRSSPSGSGEHVNLLSRGQITSLPLSEIQGISYPSAQASSDVETALELIGDSGGLKTVVISYSGLGNRRLRISYIRSTPVWKPSYRLFSGNSGSTIQGWAVIENTGSEDWRDIELNLSTANPVSFVMDLYTPRYVSRPNLPPPGLSAAPVPSPIASAPRRESARSFAGNEAAQAPMLAEAPRAYDGFADDHSEEYSVADSAPARADGQISGSLASVFSYQIEGPVSLGAQKSAMIPTVNAPLDVESYLTWRSDANAPVYRALNIVNSSGYFFTAGPMAIYDQGEFAGEAILDFMAPGGTRRIEYALEDRVSIKSQNQNREDSIFEIRASGGILETRYRQLRNYRYSIENNGNEELALRLLHRRSPGWEISGAPEFDDNEGYAEFIIDLPAEEQSVLEFLETRELSRSYQLVNLQDANLELFIASGVLDERQTAVLSEITALRRAVDETQQSISSLQGELRRIYSEQDRIIRNLEALEAESALYRRYTESLNSQEDRIEQIQVLLTQLEEELGRRRRQLGDYISEVEF